MSIYNSTRIAGPFTGTGLVATYSFGFKIFQPEDLYLVRVNLLGQNTVLQYGTDYTVIMNADQDNAPGGSITLTANLPSGFLLTITTNLAYTQPLVLQNLGKFNPSVINNALDRLTILIQQAVGMVTRTITLPITDPNGLNATVPAATARAGRALVFGADGSVGVSEQPFNDQGATSAAASAAAALVSQNAANSSAGAASASATLATNAKADAINARDAAIAAVGAVKISANDTTAGNLFAKLLAGNSFTRTILNPGTNESLRFDLVAATNAILGGLYVATKASLAARVSGYALDASLAGPQRPFVLRGSEGYGLDVSSVITADGKLLVTGRGTYGHIGLGSADVEQHGFTETYFPLTEADINVVQVVMNYQWTYVLMANGQVYVAGVNTTGSTGTASTVIFTLLPFPEPIGKIWGTFNSGGCFYAYGGIVAKAKNSNKYYGLGFNGQGQAAGGSGDTVTPKTAAVQWPNDYEDVFPCIDGGGMVYARDASKILWAWGHSFSGTLGIQSANNTTANVPNRAQVLNVPQTVGEFVVDVRTVITDDTQTAGEQYYPLHIAITNLGRVYVWGFNGAVSPGGGLGFTGAAPNLIGAYVPSPQKLLDPGDALLGGRTMAKVGVICSYINRGMYGVTTDKTLYTWGFVDTVNTALGRGTTGGTRGPGIPDIVGEGSAPFIGAGGAGVEQVIVNHESTNGGAWMAVRTTAGRVYVSGYTGGGGLGLGSAPTNTGGQFISVPMAQNRKIVDIFVQQVGDTAGVGMVDEFGNVWGCGPNAYSQRGIPNPGAVTHVIHKKGIVL